MIKERNFVERGYLSYYSLLKPIFSYVLTTLLLRELSLIKSYTNITKITSTVVPYVFGNEREMEGDSKVTILKRLHSHTCTFLFPYLWSLCAPFKQKMEGGAIFTFNMQGPR